MKYHPTAMSRTPWVPPPGWHMKTVEIVPGLLIGTKIVPPADYGTLAVDAIVDLEDWGFGWCPPVPTGAIYVSFPMEDDEKVDPKVSSVAGFVASLIGSGHRVLVHCTEGLNRSGIVAARALMDLGWPAKDAIALVRRRRGPSDDGMHALSNHRFVEWLLGEP
jgi:Dual specificity phosphatase, catalytic domain